MVEFTKEDMEEALQKKLEEAVKQGIEITKPPKKYSDILKNPELFNLITEQEFNKKIVGETETRKVIFLCGAGGRLIENCQIASFNVLVNDEAGAGKDYITHKVLEIIPKENYIKKSRISPTAFTYWHNSAFEPDWTWNGKVFYAEDISEHVLNSDVFKVMCSSGSSATITIRQRAYDIEVEGKPVVITTTATSTPSPELTRRFVILNLDSSEEQTKAIKKRHSEYAKLGIVPEYEEDFKLAQKFLKRVKVKIPFADLIDEHFPDKSIIMRTHYPRFLDYIKASAGFHQYQRKTEKGFILAEGQDYDIARDCFLKLCSNKYMIALTINQKNILGIFEKNPHEKFSVTQFHAKHNFMSIPALQTNLGILTKYCFLHSEIGKDSYGRDMELYSLSDSYNPNESLDIPTYAELLKHLKHLKQVKQVKHLKHPNLKADEFKHPLKHLFEPKKSPTIKKDVKDVKDVKAENDISNSTFTPEDFKKAGYSEQETKELLEDSDK